MPPRKPLVLPSSAPVIVPERFRISERRAPPAAIGAGLSGWMEWSLIDRQGRVRQGGEQSNLILNVGLDALPAQSQNYGRGWPWMDSLTDFITHMAVGTSSVAPAVTDTGLVAEVGRTATLISAPTASNPSAGNYTYTITREFDFAVGNGNLTEWAMCRGATGNLWSRELFRDEFDTPITIVKTSDFKLRITYTLTLALTPTTDTAASFDVTGIGTLNGNYRFHAGSNFHDRKAFTMLMMGYQATPGFGFNGYAGLSSSPLPGYTTNLSASFGSTSKVTDAYVGGSYERLWSEAFWATSAGNTTWATIGYASDNSFGFGFTIDVADRFTKTDLYQMTLTDPFRVTWGRAP